jgi:hypothetical protein
MPAASIRNCVFAYQCTRTWDSLRKTANGGIRFCGDCQREVLLCADPWALSEAIALNRCVAIVLEDMQGGGIGTMLLGEVASPPYLK